jgi:uncharacterized membrane protein/protein-disulfide isomerase
MKIPSNEQDAAREGFPQLGWIRLLAVGALGLSLFLLWGSLSGEKLPGCGLESGCGTVLHSKWSKLFGLPVSLPALLLYAMILAVTGLLPRALGVKRQRYWRFLLAAAAALIGAAVWFISLQFFVIKAICPFCMAAHTCGLIVGTLLFWAAPRGKTRPWVTGVAWLGWLGAVLLALGQIAYQPKTFDVLAVAAEPFGRTRPDTNHFSVVTTNSSVIGAATNAAKSTALVTSSEMPKAPRTIELHGGVFNLALDEVPLMGSPNAPFVIVHLFDYSCQHCRRLHPILTRAIQELSNQVAIISLPVPLATNCNRLVKRPIPDHVNACEYAYDGLALWRAKRAKLPEFEDWIFAPLRPPAPPEARAEAMRLAGTNDFADALKDPWIKEQLAVNIRIYETNYARYRRSQLPQLMIGTNIVTGVLRSVDDLYQLISAQFPIQLPVGAMANKTNSSAQFPSK